MVLAICAISARFSKHPAVRHEPASLAGEQYAIEARRQLLKNFDVANITNLTVCIILGMHELGSSYGGGSWAFGAMATGMAHAMRLHKEVDLDPPHNQRPDHIPEEGLPGDCMSFTDEEIRRRSMWACFVMDRLNSAASGRPWTINELDMEIQLPVNDRNIQLDSPAITERLDGSIKDDSDLPEEEKHTRAAKSMGTAAYTVRIIDIFGRVVKYVNQVRDRSSFYFYVTISHSAQVSPLSISSIMYLQTGVREARRKISGRYGIQNHILPSSMTSCSISLRHSLKHSPTRPKTLIDKQLTGP